MLDVKVGSGAFLQDAGPPAGWPRRWSVSAPPTACGPSRCVTDMDAPLGRGCGNASRSSKSREALRGGGPADLVEVTVVAGARDAAAGRARRRRGVVTARRRGHRRAGHRGVGRDGAGAGRRPRRRPAGGLGSTTWSLADHPATSMARRPRGRRAGARLGAGRSPQGGPGTRVGGVDLPAQAVGDPVEAGEPVLRLHVDDEARLPGALAALDGAIAVGPEPPTPRPFDERIA